MKRYNADQAKFLFGVKTHKVKKESNITRTYKNINNKLQQKILNIFWINSYSFETLSKNKGINVIST